MRFSIIIPVYNKAPYVAKALQSVFEQTCQDYELIVVDDGSHDGSDSIVENAIKASQQPTTKVMMIRQENAGVSTARNNGVAASHGEYVCFLDADDWWEPTFLEEMSALIEEFSDAGIYGTGYYIVKNQKKRVAPIGVTETDFVCNPPAIIQTPQPHISPSEKHIAQCHTHATTSQTQSISAATIDRGFINYCRVYARSLCMPLWTGAVCMPRCVFDEFGGFRSHLKLGEDFDLWIKVALKYQVAFLNKPLSNYNQDVDVTYRGTHHLHDPEVHMLWNLDYLSEVEKISPDYKQLIDNLRTYGLFPYYLSKKYHQEAKNQLLKVDWTKQNKKWNSTYKEPLVFLRIKHKVMVWGVKLKQLLDL